MIPAYRLLSAVILLLGAQAIFSAEMVVIPLNDKVVVYRNEVRQLFEEPLFTVSASDRLLVLDTRSEKYRIRDRNGREGWVEQRLCIRAPRGTSLSGFDPAQVVGNRSDNGFSWIPGDPPPPEDTIVLSRSFKRELRVNMDQEEAQRAAAY